ncbi:MAG: hypothetical protein QXV94_01635 [Thermoplasmata archaeon]
MILDSAENIPKNISAILCSSSETINFDTVIHCDINDVEKCIRTAASYIFDKDAFLNIVIGIDPGPVPGMVVVGDGFVLEEKIIIDNILSTIKKIYEDYKFLNFKIKIGSGDIINRNNIINQLIEIFALEIVDEKNTSEYKRNDIVSARKIAFLNGTVVSERQPIHYKNGGITEIQKKSRMLSDGKITISRLLAKKVLSGKISIKQAIEIQEKNNKK